MTNTKRTKRRFYSLFRFKKKSILVILLLLFICLPSKAQDVVVSGVVTDIHKDPIIGATIHEKGKHTAGTISDVDGKFSFTVSSLQSSITISLIGMKTLDIELKGKSYIEAVMTEMNIALDEVVVTALGIKKQAKAVGYAIAEVGGDEIIGGRDGNAITALSGRLAGVDISTGSGGPAGSTRVLIRGNSQLSGTNMPLYVVDGVPMDNTQLGSADNWGGYDMGDGLASLNPNDIESISVLKGASASALYGSRASNGVVLITTKSGKSEKGLGVEFSSNVNAVFINKGFDDYQREYGQGTNGQPPVLASSARTSTQNAWGARLDPNSSYYIYNGEKRPYANKNNNILSFFRTGVTFTNSVSVSNSTDKNDIRFSVSDMRNKDIVPQSDMYRTTFMLRGSAKLGSKLTVEGRANYTREGVNNRPALSDSPNNIGNSIIGIAPNFDQKWLKQGYKDEEGRYNSWNGNSYRLNPYWVLNEMENKSNKDRLMGHFQASYDILPYLTAQVKVGTDYNKFKFSDYASKFTDGILPGRMTETLTEIHETNYEGMLRFDKRFDKFDVSAMFGGNIMKYDYESYYNKGEDQIMMDVKDIMNYSISFPTQHTHLRKQVNSLFGTINLGYGDFVYVDFSVRNDISSTLHKDKRSYVYPSVSGSLVFSELVDLNRYGLSFGKVRASWAKVGGDTDPYMLDLMYNLLPYTIGGKPAGQIASKVMPNNQLKPTSTFSYELGIDLRFLQDRIGIDFGFYHQNTKNQIMRMPISLTSGYESAMINAGEISNKGIEVAINAIPVRTKNFEWSSNLNFARNINKVKSLHPDVDVYELSAARWAGASVVAVAGENYGAIMGKKIARNEQGQMIVDNEGLPTFEENVSVMGNGTYSFTLGWGNTLRYKDFSVGFLLDMKFGADIFSMSSLQSYRNGTSKHTLEGRDAWNESEQARMAANKTAKEWMDMGNIRGFLADGVVQTGVDDEGNPIWTENTMEVNPQKYWERIADNSPEPFIKDASYIKLRELTLTYNLPKKWLRNTPLESVGFTAYGRNLWSIYSKVDNIDPESNYNNGNGQGLEYGSLPSRRTFGFGINVKF